MCVWRGGGGFVCLFVFFEVFCFVLGFVVVVVLLLLLFVLFFFWGGALFALVCFFVCLFASLLA